MTISFFTWLTLLRKFELSYLYPFEGLDKVLLAFGAWLFLREKMTRNLWIGVILICLGTTSCPELKHCFSLGHSPVRRKLYLQFLV
jgi:drug/metabolite transporter (DMT)-like permease